MNNHGLIKFHGHGSQRERRTDLALLNYDYIASCAKLLVFIIIVVFYGTFLISCAFFSSSFSSSATATVYVQWSIFKAFRLRHSDWLIVNHSIIQQLSHFSSTVKRSKNDCKLYKSLYSTRRIEMLWFNCTIFNFFMPFLNCEKWEVELRCWCAFS
jgi:hypothetical protein